MIKLLELDFRMTNVWQSIGLCIWLLSQVVGFALPAPQCGSGLCEQLSYCEPISATGPVAFVNPFRFSTKYCDDETGHYNYGYRHYSPTQGRWLSRDPIGEEGGLNLYGYVGNDPINSIDSLGLMSKGKCYSLLGSGAGAMTINGMTYVVTTKLDFIVALKSATSDGSKIHIFIYYGHGNPDDGGLAWASNKDPVTSNGYISPQELQMYLERFKDLFDPKVCVELKSCGSANPNTFSSVDAFKQVFPESKVSGYTGFYLPFVGGVKNNSYFARGNRFPNTPHRSLWITK